MKRTNVIVDEELLEKARRATGERTYSGAINKALKEVVRLDRLNRSLDRFYAEAAKGDYFWPGYREEITPPDHAIAPPKARLSANEKRAPRKNSRRGPR